MRAALITESGYPYHTGSTSSWCHSLVRGLDRCTYHVVALTGDGTDRAPAYRLPANAAPPTPVPVWSAPVTPRGWPVRRRIHRAATSAALLLCRSLPGDHPRHPRMFREALVQLTQLAASGVHPLTGTALADILADTWRAAGTHPPLNLAEATAAAVLLEHAVRPLAAPVPTVDLCHATSAGLPLLVALAVKWRTGTPYLLSEHGIYVRERYLDYGEALPEPVRAVMLRFFTALARLGYAEAATVVAASRFNQRWQLGHGAPPAAVMVVPGGVDPVEFPVTPEPKTPTVVVVGRITPSADLTTVIHAFAQVTREVTGARLRLVGPVTDPGYESECRSLVRRLRLAGVVALPGPVRHPMEAYASGALVARSSVCEGEPYPVLEAMMAGRAVVATDVGGTAELVGDAGLLVPPGEPGALAAALVGLLRDPERRNALGSAARQRARSQFSQDRMLRAYRQLYPDVVAPRWVAPPTDLIMHFASESHRRGPLNCMIKSVGER